MLKGPHVAVPPRYVPPHSKPVHMIDIEPMHPRVTLYTAPDSDLKRALTRTTWRRSWRRRKRVVTAP